MMSLTLRSAGALLALAGLVLSLITLHSGLMVFGPTWAIGGTALATFALAGLTLAIAAGIERYKRKRTHAFVQNMLNDHPVIGLASAALAGVLTRFGLDADQLTKFLKIVLSKNK